MFGKTEINPILLSLCLLELWHLVGQQIFIRNRRMGRVGRSWRHSWVRPGASPSEARDGMGLILTHVYITGEVSIPLPFSLSSLAQGIHFPGNFSKGFMGSSWFQDEPHSEQEKLPMAAVNGDMCS